MLRISVYSIFCLTLKSLGEFQVLVCLALSGAAFVLMIVLLELIFRFTIINIKVASGSNAQEKGGVSVKRHSFSASALSM